MDYQDPKEQLLSLFKKYWIILGLAGFGLIFFIYGLISLFGTSSNSDNIKFETKSTNITSDSSDFSQSNFAVDVEGEVVNPGVYKLKPNSIVQDGLIAAGGLTDLADRNWVAKNLNLALKLADGQKIYIPKEGETANAPAQSTLGSSTSNSSGSMININSATDKDLDTLPGIGPVTAAKIINNRPYGTIDQLLEKKSVSQKVFDQIKDKIIAQ